MPRYDEEEVRCILSQDHLENTARALGKRPDEVAAEDLIRHWKQWNIQREIVHFEVEAPIEPYPLPPEPVNMCARCGAD